MGSPLNVRTERPALAAREAHNVTYLEATAVSLIHAARRDRRLATHLTSLVRTLPPIAAPERAPALRADLITPPDTDTAVRQAVWLRNEISLGAEGAREAHRRLAGWVKDQPVPNPQQIIIGIIGVAIPGFTLGLIKKIVKVNVVVRRDLAAGNPARLTALTSRAVLALTSGALRQAAYETARLEPDLADWFFGEQTLELYHADLRAIARIEARLARLGIPAGRAAHGGTTGVLAVSPAVESLRHHVPTLELLTYVR